MSRPWIILAVAWAALVAQAADGVDPALAQDLPGTLEIDQGILCPPLANGGFTRGIHRLLLRCFGCPRVGSAC